MCIVQKEDSLDSIAARYGIHSQELVMFNRLADRQLQTGQILYIPLSG
jgi:stage VI sporulation protein D